LKNNDDDDDLLSTVLPPSELTISYVNEMEIFY